METTYTTQSDILTLILADMRNRKLIMGLEAAGLRSDDFYTDLVQLILSGMEFPDPQDEHVQSWYEDTIECIIQQELPYFRAQQHALADRFYKLLLLKKHALDGSVHQVVREGIERMFEELVSRC